MKRKVSPLHDGIDCFMHAPTKPQTACQEHCTGEYKKAKQKVNKMKADLVKIRFLEIMQQENCYNPNPSYCLFCLWVVKIIIYLIAKKCLSLSIRITRYSGPTPFFKANC